MPDPITPERIAAIRTRMKKASVGPWYSIGDEVVRYGQHTTVRYAVAETSHPGDAAFIAHARQDVSDLMDEVDRLQVENDELNASLEVIIRALASDGWTSVKERLPEQDEQYVLVARHPLDVVYIAQYTSGYFHKGGDTIEPTHWHQLPEPPAEVK